MGRLNRPKLGDVAQVRRSSPQHQAAVRRFQYDPHTRQVRQVVIDPSRPFTAKDLPLGATVWGNGVAFLLWAPKASRVELVLDNGQTRTLTPDEHGYVSTHVEGIGPGTRYGYRLDDNSYVMPDPGSHRQPDGEMGLSEVVDHAFAWKDGGWKGRSLAEMNITETHVGTATSRGTFEGLRKVIGSSADDTVELMPLHQFPGKRNWGYDPAQLFAVQNTYGTPQELKRLVNKAHGEKKAVLIDVVHNHPGPQGAFSGAYGPYFEGKRTPWGGGVNVEGAQGREVTRHFIENALFWLNEYHADGLRFDATVFLPPELLAELSEAVRQLEASTGRKYVLISENNRNNSIVTKPVKEGGHGFDGQWSMDLQYALRALLANEKGWRIDRYVQAPFDWALKAIARGWGYEGQRSPFPGDLAEQPDGHFGTPAVGVPAPAMVVAKDDHDQIGNTPLGQRLGNRIGPRLDRAVDALFSFLPFTVMKFQGDDYRAKQPFDFFVDVDPSSQLATDIRNGRNREWDLWLQGQKFRDPISEETYQGNVLDPRERNSSPHREAMTLSQELLKLRTRHPVLKARTTETYEVIGFKEENAVVQRRWTKAGQELLAVTNFSDHPVELDLAQGGVVERTGEKDEPRRPLSGQWKLVLNTEDARFGGEGVGPVKGQPVDFTKGTRLTVPAGSALYLEKA